MYWYWYWYLKVKYSYLYWYLDHWYWHWYWYLFVEYLIQDCGETEKGSLGILKVQSSGGIDNVYCSRFSYILQMLFLTRRLNVAIIMIIGCINKKLISR